MQDQGHDQVPDHTHGAFIRALFAALAEGGVAHCVLRNWQGLPEDCGNDLDVFVEAAKRDLAAARLISVAAAHKLIARRKTAKYGYISYDFHNWETRQDLKIDFFTKIHFQGLETISPEAVLSDPIDHSGIPVANASAANFINAYKDILDSGIIKGKYRADINSSLMDPAGAPRLREHFAEAFGECGPRIIEAVLAGDGTPDPASARSLRRLLRARKYRGAPLAALTDQVAALWQRLTHGRRRLKSERLTIALMGPDGSGKSTISEMMRQKLIPPDQDILYKHGRPGYIPALREVLNMVRRMFRRTPLKSNPKGKDALQDRVHSPTMASIYVAYYFLDFWLDEISFKLSRRVAIRVFDRYWYDYFFLPSFVHLPRPMTLFFQILPSADRLLILIADPDKIYARKKELTLDQIRFQNERAMNLAAKLPEARLIRTDGGFDDTARAIAEALGQAM
jgi:hypothetical protein